MAVDVVHHGGLIARRIHGRWQGVLILGSSGAGKSDLALRALGHGFRLVADDRVLLWEDREQLFGRAPDPLRDRLEVRGLGVIEVNALAFCRVALVVHLQRPDRLPDRGGDLILGVALPHVVVEPFEASAPAKIGRALTTFDAAHKRRI